MTLVDVCDFAESLAIADHVYMGDLLRRMRSPLACITASTNRCTTLRWAVLPDMGRNMLLSLYTGINLCVRQKRQPRPYLTGSVK